MTQRLRSLRQSLGDLKLTYIQAVALVFSLERMYGGKYVPHIGSHSCPFLYLKILIAAGTARDPLGFSSSSNSAFPSGTAESAVDLIAAPHFSSSPLAFPSSSRISRPTVSTTAHAAALLGRKAEDGSGGGPLPTLSSSFSSPSTLRRDTGGGSSVHGFWALSQRDYLLGLVGILMPRRTKEERAMRESLMEFCSSMWYASLRSEGYEGGGSSASPLPTHVMDAPRRSASETVEDEKKEEEKSNNPHRSPFSSSSSSSGFPKTLGRATGPFSSFTSSASSNAWSAEELAGLYKRTLVPYSSSGNSNATASPSPSIPKEGSPEICELHASPLPPPPLPMFPSSLPLSPQTTSDMVGGSRGGGAVTPDPRWSGASRGRLLLDSATAISGSFFQGVTGRVLLFDAIATCMAGEESIRLEALKRRRQRKLASLWKDFHVQTEVEKGSPKKGGAIDEKESGRETPSHTRPEEEKEKIREGRAFDGASCRDGSLSFPSRSSALYVNGEDRTAEGGASSSPSCSPSSSTPSSRYYSSVQQDNIHRIAQRIAVNSAMREKMEQLLRQEKQQGWIKRRLLLVSPHQPTTTPRALQQFSLPPSFYHRSSFSSPPSSSSSISGTTGAVGSENAEGCAGGNSSGGATTTTTSQDHTHQEPSEATRSGGSSFGRKCIRWTPEQQRSALLLVRMRPEEEVEDFIVRCEPLRQELLRVLRRGRERRKNEGTPLGEASPLPPSP